MKITYMCRHCNKVLIFLNRCNLLSHIRSHAFKTATINVSDLKVEPLPLEMFTIAPQEPVLQSKTQASTTPIEHGKKKNVCFECKEIIYKSGVMFKDRASHYMRYTNEMHSCPVCLFVLPTKCGLDAHLRIHLKIPPYFCPECGVYMTSKSVQYPYNHDCQGFKMMRATVRVTCPLKQCAPFHPSQSIDHRQRHIKKVFKCPTCIVACFNKEAIEKHLTKHADHSIQNFILFYQCEMCPGRLVVHNQLDNHFTKGHVNNYVYPCWQCNVIFPEVSALITHHKNKLCKGKTVDKTRWSDTDPKDVLYRVLKRCDSCKVYFTYRCKYDEINHLPNECPYKCSPGDQVIEVSRTEHNSADTSNQNDQIVCHLCKMRIPIDWNDIKIHYSIHHKQFKCLDPRVSLQRADLSAYKKKNRKKRIGPVKKVWKQKTFASSPRIHEITKQTFVRNESTTTTQHATQGDHHACNKCNEHFKTKKSFEDHILIHRDPCTAYQCLECGECFVVKPSFSMHLLIEHGISNVEEYVQKNNCFNESALHTDQNKPENDEPLREHQCNICRDQYDNQEDLEKHYRVHGMAFLMKKTMNKNSP